MNEIENRTDAPFAKSTSQWISIKDKMPDEFVSVLGFMEDEEDFPPVRECYNVCGDFFFPALREVHPVSCWMPMPAPPTEEK